MRKLISPINVIGMAAILVGAGLYIWESYNLESLLGFKINDTYLWIAFAVLVLILGNLPLPKKEPQVGDIIIVDREQNKRNTEKVAYSSMLIFDSITDILEESGICTHEKMKRKIEEIRQKYSDRYVKIGKGG